MTQDIHTHEHSPAPENAIKAATRLGNQRRRHATLAWLEEPYNHASGEMALWIAVITQAMMDALSHVDNAESNYYKHEAIHWLSGNSKDFIMVCMCAGLDPDYVRRQAKRALVSPVAWRAEAGKGKRYLERKAYRRSKKNVSASRESQSDCAGSQNSSTGSNVIPAPRLRHS